MYHRTLQKSTASNPVTLSRACLPYGMREVEGFGDDVWEFFNRQYEVIGVPFRFMEPLSSDFLESVSYEYSGTNLAAPRGGRMVIFGPLSDDRELKTMRRIVTVMELPIETEIEPIVNTLPKTWDVRERSRIERWDNDAY